MINHRYIFPSGAIELSTTHNGTLIKMQYVGWDLATAKKLFKLYIKDKQ